MTDRDPIAAALEDLRKKEAAERKEEPFRHFEMVTSGVISIQTQELWEVAAFFLEIDAKFIEEWTPHFASLPQNEVVQLAVVRAREPGRLSDIRTRLADDGLTPANLRDLCAFTWNVEATELLYALGSTLTSRRAGEERVPYRLQKPAGADFDRIAERTPSRDDERAFLPDESLFLVRIVPQPTSIP